MNKHVIEVPELGIQILDKVGIKLEIFLFEGLRNLEKKEQSQSEKNFCPVGCATQH